MKLWILLILAPMLSFAVVQRDSYQICLNSTNRAESPADRDAAKVDCFNKQVRAKRTVDTCTKLARVLEHTSASDALILDCLADNILKLKLSECVATAKKLTYSENRDKALWSCIENRRATINECKGIVQEMTFPHNKNVALNYCRMNN